MLLATLPFDYLQQIDRGDRVRLSRTRPNGTRVRRGTWRAGRVSSWADMPAFEMAGNVSLRVSLA
jgi:hypothetical protein